MATFTGGLLPNKVFATLFNQIISLQTFSTGISDLGGIYSSRKVDGTLYGDTKLYVSTDALKSYDWDGTDGPGSYNLLTVHKPPAPHVDAIRIDIFRQIPLTVDEYLTKQAWTGQDTFSEFHGIILSWLNKTKEVYEHTKYTTDIVLSAEEKATTLINIDLTTLPTGITGYDALKYKAQEMYRLIEDAIDELKEPSRKYNDLGFLRNYTIDDFDIVVPLGVLSNVRKHDIPFLYNADEKPRFKQVHWKYFGDVNDTGGTTVADNTTIRSLIEKDYGAGVNMVHVFPGDLLPNSTDYLADETYTATFTEAQKPSFEENFPILLIHKEDFPIMSAFSVGTSFFNARRLDINHYLTFGHNNVFNAHLQERALLKIGVENK